MLHLAQHIIGRSACTDIAACINVHFISSLVGVEGLIRYIIDRVIKCFRADSRPFCGNMLVCRNGLVKVKLCLRLCNVSVFIRYIPTIQCITISERTRNNAICRVTRVCRNFLFNGRTGIIDHATVQMEGHRIGRRIPNCIEPQVALNGESLSSLPLCFRILIHGPLHIHTGWAKAPALECPCGRAVFRPVRADSGFRVSSRPAICRIRIFVLIVQLIAILFLSHQCAVRQLDGAQRHLDSGRNIVGGRHVGDGIPVSVIVEIEVIRIILLTTC